MRVACPLYKPLAVLAGRAGLILWSIKLLSFSSVQELSKQRSNGAVMALLLPACMY